MTESSRTTHNNKNNKQYLGLNQQIPLQDFQQSDPNNPQLDLSVYYTTDTPLASYLHSLGFIIQDTKPFSNKPVTVFSFQKTEELMTRVSLWQKGQAEGNCFQFYNSYKLLVRLVKNSKNY